MNMETSHEHELLTATVRKFVDTEMMPHEDEVDRLGQVPEEIGRQIEARAHELGLFACNLPEEVGGGGLDLSAQRIIEQEFGKTTHALHSWAARPTEILLACEGDQREKYLLPCVRGEKRELFALTEPDAGSDAMGMKSNARRDGDDWILNGSKHFISGPCMPDFAIVFAATGADDTPRGPRKRVTAFLVDVGTPGFVCREGTRSVSYRGYKTFELHFDNVRLGPGQILGEEGRGFEIAGQWLGMGRIWVGASCCGKAERILDMATEWAANRRQFGQPIGSFQATGFRLADGAMNLRAANLMVTDAVARHRAGRMADQDAAMVKVFCSEMLGRIADDAVQIFGGMGLMEELPVQRLWRDSRLERIWDGTSEIQRHIITRSMLRPLGA
ncbi:acyl-CoA dehydrogenase family protein [Ruegeria pomeroyi DSS-3]|uniref:Medium-chain specific acyl-CoA dehydrogenase, mitochondrial n=2 Tax=Ruegeria pomeroyi TaxID=89184 RepID=Q5LPZ8_RUEPO|nr:acyl-CoA dehydrogenase family protein [Ruegeria pomeroyi DSS-3]NVK98190.1 acyl-CoA dehydrogenase family protein [Ruegeria pomeroyi]NVL02031.1 acyl-CoA dehydrogenase family protein [Ruegeria pomeroyi]